MTARGRGSGIDWTQLTIKQLDMWGVKYHELEPMFHKPTADLFIDDKGINSEEWKKTLPPKKGIIAGALWFRYLSDDLIRIFIGMIAIIFVLSYLFEKEDSEPTKVSYTKGTFFGSLSGFISFGIHAGGLPFNMYMLPQKLDQRILVGTAALFFAIMNYVKLFPYYLLGQLSYDNLLTSFVLMPLALLGFFVGYYLTHKVEEKLSLPKII